MTIIKRTILVITLSLLALPTHSDGSEKLVAEMLEISEIHYSYAEGIVAGYRISAAAEHKAETEIDCFVAKVTPELVLPALVGAYSSEFTDDELDLAITFLRSKPGSKYVRYQRIKAKQALGLPTPERLPQFSARETEMIGAFAETHVGRLILAPDSAVSAAVRTAIRPQLMLLRDQCKLGTHKEVH
jgi:hypothetical protein